MEIQISVKNGDVIIASSNKRYTVNVLRQAVEPYCHYDKYILSDENDNNLPEVFYDANVLHLFKNGMIYNKEQQKLYALEGTITASDVPWLKENLSNICAAIKRYEEDN